MMKQSDIDARLLVVQQYYREAEQYRDMKIALSVKPSKAPIIIIPVAPRSLYQKARKSVLFWLAGLFPEAACRYNWVPCPN